MDLAFGYHKVVFGWKGFDLESFWINTSVHIYNNNTPIFPLCFASNYIHFSLSLKSADWYICHTDIWYQCSTNISFIQRDSSNSRVSWVYWVVANAFLYIQASQPEWTSARYLCQTVTSVARLVSSLSFYCISVSIFFWVSVLIVMHY